VSAWPLVSLEEIAIFQTGKLNSNQAVENGQYPFFTCSPETLNIDHYAFDCEAVLLAGNNANGIFPVKYYNGRFNAYQRTYVITAKDSKRLDLKYFYYQVELLTSRFTQHSIGTATKFLTMQILNKFAITLPPLPTQRRIAEILGRLDNKIEMNRRINQTLEAMAQALFQYYFVEFGPYQDELMENEEGPIPQGWELGRLEYFVLIENKSISPQDFPEEVFNHYSIPAHDNMLPTQDFGAEVKSNKFLITSDRILVSKLNPQFYRIWTVYHRDDYRSFSSTEFVNYTCRLPHYWAFMNCHLRSQSFITELRSRVMGTTGSRQRVHPQETLAFPVIKPPIEILEWFEKIVGPYLLHIQYNIEENRKLAEIRDYLLPRLLSGEVAV
jgi:type I restriction enzyme, S subunit